MRASWHLIIDMTQTLTGFRLPTLATAGGTGGHTQA